MNNKGNTVREYPHPFAFSSYERIGPHFSESSLKYTYGGELHMKGHSDTLYVFRGGERYPKYVFKNSFSIDGKRNLTQTEYDNAIVVTAALETRDKLLFNIRIGGNPPESKQYELCYDKTTGHTFSYEIIRNDLTSAYPGSTAVRREYGAEFGDMYGVLFNNTFSTVPGYPKDEKASYFFHLFNLK